MTSLRPCLRVHRLSHPAWTAAALAVVLLVTRTALAAPPTAQTALKSIVERGTIRLAARENAVPFSYLINGQPAGYSVDLCLRIVEALRKELRLPRLVPVWISSDSVAKSMALIKSNAADVECGATVSTHERREQVQFTVPHFFSIGRVLTVAPNNAKVVADFQHKAIAVAKGTTTHRRLREMLDRNAARFKLVEVASAGEGFAMLRAGQVDAFANFEAQLRHWRAGQPNPEAYAVVGEAMAVEPVALILPRGDPQFKRRIDTIVSHQMIDGRVSELYSKWFERPIPPSGTTIGMPMSEVLRGSMAFPVDILGMN